MVAAHSMAAGAERQVDTTPSKTPEKQQPESGSSDRDKCTLEHGGPSTETRLQDSGEAESACGAPSLAASFQSHDRARRSPGQSEEVGIPAEVDQKQSMDLGHRDRAPDSRAAGEASGSCRAEAE